MRSLPVTPKAKAAQRHERREPSQVWSRGAARPDLRRERNTKGRGELGALPVRVGRLTKWLHSCGMSRPGRLRYTKKVSLRTEIVVSADNPITAPQWYDQ